MNNNTFSGIWTALATPFDENKQIDWDSFEKIIRLQVQSGVRGLVICGTTGESPTLSIQEKLSLVRKAKVFAGDNLAIMAGTGSSHTEQSCELSRLAVEAGADSLLIVTPPYNKPNISGLLEHYKAIAASTPAPVCLYHVPGRTNQKLTSEEIQQILEIEQVELVKEASSDLFLFSQIANSSTAILSGDDPTFLASLAVGGQGNISVAANIFPKTMVAIYRSFQNGDNATALRLNQILESFYSALFCEVNPAPLKAIGAHFGLYQNVLRLPLTTISSYHQQKVSSVADQTAQRLKEEGIHEQF